MIVPSLYADLMQSSKLPGCPVCRIVNQRVDDYLRGLYYEKVNDINLRQQLRSSRGFCSEHAWSALRPGVGDALGVSIIYHDVLTNILRELPADTQQPGGGRWGNFLSRLPRSLGETIKTAQEALRPKARCLACVQRDEISALVIQELSEGLRDPTRSEELIPVLGASDGLCLPHLRRAFAAQADDRALMALTRLTRQKLEALDAELAEYIRKNDYRFQGEAFGSERDAWKRAIALAAGELTQRGER
jgi:hypothetical protein